MKKGLLSLLAVALTVVGCQNYDDQFDDLKTQITDLANTVAGLTQVQSDLDALDTLVRTLSDAVNAIPTNPATASDLQPLSDALAAAQADIDSLEALLNSNQALTQTQLGQISTTLADVAANVETLLQGDAVVSPASGSIIINNQATLIAAQNLIPEGAEDGSLVLDGSLYVMFTSPGLTTAAQMTDVNEVLSKFVSIIGEVNIINSQPAAVTTGVSADGIVSVSQNVSLTGTGAVGPSMDALSSVGETLELNTTGAASLDAIVSVGADLDMLSDNIPTMNTLTSVGGDFNRASGSAPSVDNLSSVGGDLIAEHSGDWGYTQVDTVGGDVIVGWGASSVDLSGVTVTGSIMSNAPGATAGELIMNTATATGDINIGSASIDLITANGAQRVVGAATSLTSITINAEAAQEILFNSVTAVASQVTINATPTTVIRFNLLETSGNIDINNADEAHFPELESVAGTLSIDADDQVDLRSLETVSTGNPDVQAETVNIDAVAGIRAGSTFNLPNATSVESGALILTAAGGTLSVPVLGTVEIASIVDTSKLSAADMTSLTVTALDGDLAIVNADFPELVTLTVTGKAVNPTEVADVSDVSTLDIAKTSTSSLTTVVAGGELQELTVDSNWVESITTSANSEITDVTIDGTSVDNIVFNHTYLPYDTAATVDVQNTAITTLNMSSIGKVKGITLTGNGSLASLEAPSSTVLAEPAAVIAVTLGTNSFTATYTDGVVASETEVSALPSISSPQIHKLVNWIEAADAVSVLGTISIDIENVTQGSSVVDIATAFTNDASVSSTSTVYGGVINTQGEFDLIGD